MALQQDGHIYIKLDQRGKTNLDDKGWDDGVVGPIKQILLWHDEYFISGFQILYESRGKCIFSKRHGGTQGNFEMINPKKPLTWLSGHYESVNIDPELFHLNEEDDPWNFYKRITSLKFGNEEETYGPFGSCVEGTPFFFRGSTEIVGVHGCSSDSSFGYISAIGLYIKTEAVGLVGQPSNQNGSVEMIEDERKPELLCGN